MRNGMHRLKLLLEDKGKHWPSLPVHAENVIWHMTGLVQVVWPVWFWLDQYFGEN